MDDRIRLRLDVALRRHRLLRLGRPARPAHRRRGARSTTLERVFGAGRRDRADRGRAHRRRGARHRAGVPRRPADGALGGAGADRWCAGWPGCCPPTCGCARSTAGAGRLRRPVLGACAGATSTGSTDAAVRAPSRCAAATPSAWPRPLDLDRAQRRRGRPGRRARLRRVLPAQGARHHDPRGHRLDWRRDPDGVAGRHGRRRTRSARRWCAAWSARCWRSATAAATGRLAGDRC